MLDHQLIVLAAIIILLFGLFSKVAEHSFITAPMVFVCVGLLIGPIGLSWLHIDIDNEAIQLLAELTLIIILFVDASFIKLTNIIDRLKGLPARLLLIGLPLTMLLGTATAIILFPSTDLWLLIVLALILSPTDAALGQAVVKSENVPNNIRDSISAESGLNDGISLPPIFVCLAIISSGLGHISPEDHWLIFLLMQLTLGPLIGGAIGYIGGKLIEFAHQRDWMDTVFQRLTCLSIAILAYVCAELFEGNGFIAAFCAGLFLGVKDLKVRARIQEFGETEGQMLTLFVFVILGLIIIPIFSPIWDVNALIYAVLSLTVVRIIPVFICLIGTGLPTYSKFFIAWFGPRGIASILYLLIALEQIGKTGHEYILSIIVLTVLLSIFAHGMTAVSMSNRFSKANNN
ncbi:MAG: sodium:proton antiporter [Colwellia sp.]|nr:sodium:proton antiporter [Colwellia sp.]